MSDGLPVLVGCTDIAYALGLTRQAVDYRLRHDPSAPSPVAVVNCAGGARGTRIWWRDDIDRWLHMEPRRWNRDLDAPAFRARRPVT